MHPYEIDTQELEAVKKQYGHIPLKWRLSQFVGRNTVEAKLKKLLTDFEFTSFELEYYSDSSQSLPRNTSSNIDEVRPRKTSISPENIIANTPYL
jgi:hypothetical protein